MKNIILASGSPRRIEIMKDHGLDPEIRPADVNENLPFYMTPEASVMYLAFKKPSTQRLCTINRTASTYRLIQSWNIKGRSSESRTTVAMHSIRCMSCEMIPIMSSPGYASSKPAPLKAARRSSHLREKNAFTKRPPYFLKTTAMMSSLLM